MPACGRWWMTARARPTTPAAAPNWWIMAGDDGLDGLFSALGGKWTTSRDLAETITDAVVKKLGAKASALRHRHDAPARRAL